MKKMFPNTSQQNGVIKWTMKTIVKCVRNMIHAQGLNLEFWAKVMDTTIYIKNQCQTKAKRLKDLIRNIDR
jgi:hypothetical protein